MNEALAWVGQIAAWFGAFIPRWEILDTTEGAIKYVKGSRVVVCGPGIHWYWPVLSRFIAYPTAEQTDRLETQTMETIDGKTFIVAGTITYRVEDLAKLIPVVHLATHSTINRAGAALHDVCCDMTWEQLQREQRKGTLKTKLKNAAKRSLERYGIEVLEFQLNTLARSRVYKVSQSTSSEEN